MTPTTAQSLNVATVCMTPNLDPLMSLQRMEQVIEEIKQEHPDTRLILFGETILGWFYKKGETQSYQESIAETIPGPATTTIGRLAQEHDCYISFGLSERADGKLFNAQVVISPEGDVIAKHRKIQIRNKVFTPGAQELVTVDIDGFKTALLICADARSPWLRREIRRAKADIVLASLADYATSSRLNQLLGTLYDSWIIVSNRYGAEPPITWHGLITVTDPWACLHGSSLGRESVLVQKILCPVPAGLARWIRRRCVGLKLIGLAVSYGVECLGRAIRSRTNKVDS